MDTQLELDFEMLVVAAPRLNVDPKFDLGPFGESGRSAGILE
jgi:hypothetical protein